MALVYSCCFWFSLRLAGILIGIFSIVQSLIKLAACSWGRARSADVADEITSWINSMDLLYIKEYLENIRSDPEKFFTIAIASLCAYIIICILYIYGAYACNNSFMSVFILVEFVRLILLTVVVATWLMIVKQNTMDIGLLIGASVAGGFLLLGMFYLWVCAANLPILINEMERDKQKKTIAKLQQLLDTNRKPLNVGLDDIFVTQSNPYRKGVFTVRRNERVPAIINRKQSYF